VKLEDIRRDYLLDGLSREALHESPIAQFELWMRQAIKSEIPDPTAMTLATVSEDGQPSQRIVLLKHVDEHGFVFFSNYSSSKAQDIELNPKVSLHFPWHPMERQVKVLGTATRVPAEESLRYFLSRPRDSQLAAWASRQSDPVDSRSVLMQQFDAMKQKFNEGEIPLPHFWGGYRVAVNVCEFWQGGANRLHDRFEYRRDQERWLIERLSP